MVPVQLKGILHIHITIHKLHLLRTVKVRRATLYKRNSSMDQQKTYSITLSLNIIGALLFLYLKFSDVGVPIPRFLDMKERFRYLQSKSIVDSIYYYGK